MQTALLKTITFELDNKTLLSIDSCFFAGNFINIKYNPDSLELVPGNYNLFLEGTIYQDGYQTIKTSIYVNEELVTYQIDNMPSNETWMMYSFNKPIVITKNSHIKIEITQY